MRTRGLTSRGSTDPQSPSVFGWWSVRLVRGSERGFWCVGVGAGRGRRSCWCQCSFGHNTCVHNRSFDMGERLIMLNGHLLERVRSPRRSYRRLVAELRSFAWGYPRQSNAQHTLPYEFQGTWLVESDRYSVHRKFAARRQRFVAQRRQARCPSGAASAARSDHRALDPEP